jgi:putative peptidoglycan lipid II flippase
VLMIILGPQIAVAVFQHGHTTPGYARLTGRVLVAFVIGLVPFSTFQMQLRAWLAVHDSRTPMLVNLWATAANLVLDVGLYVLLPNRDRAVGLALGYSLSYVIGTAIFTVKLRRRFTATHPTHVIRTYVRLGVAGVVAAVPTLLLTRLISGHTTATPLNALITIVVASAVGLGVFVLIVRRMRVSELADVMRMLPGRA